MTLGLCLSTYLEFEAFELIVTRKPDTVSVTRFASNGFSNYRLEAVSQLPPQGTTRRFFVGEREIPSTPFDEELQKNASSIFALHEDK